MNPNVPRIIDAFGGPAKLAEILNERPNSIVKWKGRRSIPNKYQRGILEAAARLKKDVTAADLCGVPRK